MTYAAKFEVPTDLTIFTKEELLTIKAMLAGDIASVKSQLDVVSRSPILDYEWFRRANGFLRFKGREMNRIDIAMIRFKEREKEENNKKSESSRDAFLVAFKECAKKELPKPQYLNICEAARLAVDGQ